MNEEREQYVYIYRDQHGIPRYIGRGKGSQRPMAHGTVSGHNAELDDWIRNGIHMIDICGPFRDEETCQIVESAVMSALLQTPQLKIRLFNKISGHSAGLFRPVGVPINLRDRQLQPPLTTSELDEITNRKNILIFVYLSKFDLSDGRKGYDLAHVPKDEEVAERAEKSWQLAKHLRDWGLHASRSPTHLVAVTGPRERRVVVACSEILRGDNGHWQMSKQMMHANGLVTVPINRSQLDALCLRGRRLSPQVPLAFNSFRHSQFRIYSPA